MLRVARVAIVVSSFFRQSECCLEPNRFEHFFAGAFALVTAARIFHGAAFLILSVFNAQARLVSTVTHSGLRRLLPFGSSLAIAHVGAANPWRVLRDCAATVIRLAVSHRVRSSEYSGIGGISLVRGHAPTAKLLSLSFSSSFLSRQGPILYGDSLERFLPCSV